MSGETTRFAFGEHIFRDGQKVVEVFQGDKFLAAIYTVAHGVRIVSRHFDRTITEPIDDFAGQAIIVRFVGSEPPGRERLSNGPVNPREDDDE